MCPPIGGDGLEAGQPGDELHSYIYTYTYKDVSAMTGTVTVGVSPVPIGGDGLGPGKTGVDHHHAAAPSRTLQGQLH